MFIIFILFISLSYLLHLCTYFFNRLPCLFVLQINGSRIITSSYLTWNRLVRYLREVFSMNIPRGETATMSLLKVNTVLSTKRRRLQIFGREPAGSVTRTIGKDLKKTRDWRTDKKESYK